VCCHCAATAWLLTLQVNKLSAALEDLSDEAVLLRRKAGLPQESTLDTSGVKLQKDVTIAQLRSVNALLERQVCVLLCCAHGYQYVVSAKAANLAREGLCWCLT
jgi:hypothetical protein